jgi:Protein of unknown function (DUF3592)
MKTSSALWYLAFGVICTICLVAGVRDYFREKAFFARAGQATATITDYVPDANPNVSDFCPLYEFTTDTGQDVAFVGDICPSRADYSKVGQQKQVYFDPADPRYTVQFKENQYDGLILGIIGFVFFSLFLWAPLLIPLVRKAARIGRPIPLSAIELRDAEKYHANQRARREAEMRGAEWRPTYSARSETHNEPQTDDEARLAQLEREEEELKRKIEERRRQQGE